jgi:hypothetical protein
VRAAMAGHTAPRRELSEEKPHAIFIRRNLRMNFCIRAFQIGACIQRRATMPGTGDVNEVRIMLFD